MTAVKTANIYNLSLHVTKLKCWGIGKCPGKNATDFCFISEAQQLFRHKWFSDVIYLWLISRALKWLFCQFCPWGKNLLISTQACMVGNLTAEMSFRFPLIHSPLSILFIFFSVERPRPCDLWSFPVWILLIAFSWCGSTFPSIFCISCKYAATSKEWIKLRVDLFGKTTGHTQNVAIFLWSWQSLMLNAYIYSFMGSWK